MIWGPHFWSRTGPHMLAGIILINLHAQAIQAMLESYNKALSLWMYA